ncbi:MAG: adenylate/guanylate cyclase domain-containing protein [Campylobacterales bacterium]|nr:adenylate/guanylate cyclase domain-containing protein [Campylobacterales bacterium]
MKNKYKALILLFLLISAILSGAYLFLPSYFQSLDNSVRDFYFNFRGPQKTSDSVVIVDIDEESIKELGQWPWERDKFAKILTNLKNGGVGVIGLDIVFSEADKTSPSKFAKEWNIKDTNLPDYDTILSETVADTPTILGYVLDFDKHNKNEGPSIPAIFMQKNLQDKEYLPEAHGVLTNLPTIQKAGYSSGFMNNIPDETGIIRSVPLLIKYDDTLYPSLAFELYRIVTENKKVAVLYGESGIEGIEIGSELIPTDRFGRLYVNFRGPAKSYKYFSAVDILNNNFNKESIEGKIVLIGTSAYGLMDLRSSPMDSVIPGVEIHANVIDNLINQDMLKKPSMGELIDIFLILFIAFIVIFIYSRLSVLWLLLVYSLSLISLLYMNFHLLFQEHIIINTTFPLFSMILSLVGILGVNYMFETRQKEMVKNSFSKKVSKQVMEDLLANPDAANFTSKEVEVSIYFSDIRSFTSISEELKSPKRITDFLNYYMNAMVESVEKHHGTIDKFIGDAIMAYWNAPMNVKNHADEAVKTALEQIAKRDFLNITINKDFGFDVDYGIGINTGDVVVGEIGSHGRSDYTIIGDAVNLASRLEGLCKPYKVRLIISEFTKAKLTESYVIQLLDKVRVKGKDEPVEIYEVISMGEPDEQKQIELSEYYKAHNLYVNAEFEKAKEMFTFLYEKYEKHLYKLYKERCEHLLNENIKEFDGVFDFLTK